MKNIASTQTMQNPKVIDLANLDIDTLEAFFPSEHPSDATASEGDPEARRKAFFQSFRNNRTMQ